jgi:putative fructosamine kinase
MIDPAAHGGHAETDLADLGLFGQQYLDSVYEGYQSVSPLESYWSERVGLHRVHMLIVHAMLFGGGYGYETVQVARHYV